MNPNNSILATELALPTSDYGPAAIPSLESVSESLRSSGISPGALVAVAMSGGVDSSAAALLVKNAGFRAVGLTMKLWSPPCNDEAGDKTCCTVDSANDAKRVCDTLGIPHFTLDMQEDFEARVMQPFYEAYLSGETPNPCVNCNSFVKWDALWERARAIGAEAIATGHYARTAKEGDSTFILRGADSRKDQSYFLWGVPPATLARTLFPLADLDKPTVRRLASEAGLKTANKTESQDICFIPKGNYRDFVADRAQGEGRILEHGPMIGPDGEQIGVHKGLPFYTVGQRKGLGIASDAPLYVKRLDTTTNSLFLGRREDLDSHGFVADRFNSFMESFGERECLVQYRYRSRPRRGIVRATGDGQVTVELLEPGEGICPGQSAVFYDGDRLIGGARIRETI